MLLFPAERRWENPEKKGRATRKRAAARKRAVTRKRNRRQEASIDELALSSGRAAKFVVTALKGLDDSIDKVRFERRLSDEEVVFNPDQLAAFEAVLEQIPTITEILITMARGELLVVDEDGEEDQRFHLISERGKGHLRELLAGLQPIARRHKWPEYTFPIEPGRKRNVITVDSAPKSKLAGLAFHLGQRLPKRLRPISEWALIGLLIRNPAKPKRARAERR
jgi:hypothetical protein